MQAAFDSLKHALISAPVLRPPDRTRTFQVTTDWSTCAIAAVLSQMDADGHEYVISYASRTLTPVERNYAPTEGEFQKQNIDFAFVLGGGLCRFRGP